MKYKITLTFLGLLSTILVHAQNTGWEEQLKSNLERIADSLSRNLQPWQVPDRVFYVDNFGAVPDSLTINTLAIQKAIDSCSATGGGTVVFSKGNYVTGTIELKSNVMLKVEKGSRIIGSTNLKDYPEKVEGFASIMSEYYEFRQSLIYAENADKIGICGEGEIYFRGEKKHFSSPQTTGKIIGRPLGIRMVKCKEVVLKDIFLHNSASWMQNYIYCENLIFDGIKVYNHGNYNNDGLDPDGCKNVIVRNCFINSEDDAMCLKGGSGKMSENILIENSTFYSTCNALKIGTDTQGPFRNIICRNLTLGGIPDSLAASNRKFASTGITLATVDGGNVENILISDVAINQVRCPIFIKIGNRFRVLPEWGQPVPGYLKNVVIENVKGQDNTQQGSFISGIRSQSVENMVIRNMDLSMDNITDSVFAGLPVNDKENGYPDAQNFSIDGLPGYGFFVRYAKNIALDDISIKTTAPDARPCFVSGEGTENLFANKKSFTPQKLVDFTYSPKYIKKVNIINDTLQPIVLKYRVGSRFYPDRSFVITHLDTLFHDAEYIFWPMNLRTSVAEELISFEITAKGTLYIAHDPLYNAQKWLSEEFTNTGMEYKVGKITMSLYSKEIEKPQQWVLGGNHLGELPVKKGANYIIIFVKAEI
jgi:polygalacturonase